MISSSYDPQAARFMAVMKRRIVQGTPGASRRRLMTEEGVTGVTEEGIIGMTDEGVIPAKAGIQPRRSCQESSKQLPPPRSLDAAG